MDEGRVFHLLAERVRLAGARKSSEACAPGGERPRGERDLEAVDGGDHLLGVSSAALEPIGQLGEVALMVPLDGGVELGGDGAMSVAAMR
jgi:hypothetical protein